MGGCEFFWCECIFALMQSNDCETVMKTAQKWNEIVTCFFLLVTLNVLLIFVYFLLLLIIEKERKILTVEIGGEKVVSS